MEQVPATNEKKIHPSSVVVLVLGVSSIIIAYIQVFLVLEIIAFVLGIIALLFSVKVNKDVYIDESKYAAPTKGFNKAGRLCSIVGIAVSIIHTIVWFQKYY